jgi:hypothetical protein
VDGGLVDVPNWGHLMDEVRKGIRAEVDKNIEQAVPLPLHMLERAPPAARAKLLFALCSGTRPVALAAVDTKGFSKVRDTDLVLRQYNLLPDKDKVEITGRTVRVMCTCDMDGKPKNKGTLGNFCPVHSVEMPDFPLSQNQLTKALKTIDPLKQYSLYSLRRRHCCSVCRIMAEDYGCSIKKLFNDPDSLSRVNAQLGWVFDSQMFERYAKKAPKLTDLDREMFEPITEFYMTGVERTRG